MITKRGIETFLVSILLIVTVFGNVVYGDLGNDGNNEGKSGSRGLTGYWNFNEGTGSVAHDSSGNGYHGTVHGATWTTGISGSGLDFTDTTDLVSGISSEFDNTVTSGFTIISWVCWDPMTPMGSHYIFDARSGTAGTGRGFILGLADEQFNFRIQSPSGSEFVRSMSTVPVNTWTHITGVYDGATDVLSVYVNGYLENSSTYTLPYYDTTLTAAIGNNRWAPGDNEWTPFEGAIDDVRFYNTALSQNEIWDIYTSSGGGNQTSYFIHITDTHFGYCGAKKAVDRLINDILTNPDTNKPEFVLVTGDLVSWGASAPGLPLLGWLLCEEESNSYLSLKSSLQAFENEDIPVYVCPGNHDFYMWPYSVIPVIPSEYLQYFNDFWPTFFEDPSWNIRVIGVTSGWDYFLAFPLFPPRGIGLTSGDLSYINNKLAGLEPYVIKIIMMHHPTINYDEDALPFAGWDAGCIANNRENLIDICDLYDVDLVCAGHLHYAKIYNGNMDHSNRDGYTESWDGIGPFPDETLYLTTENAYGGWYRKIEIHPEGLKIFNAHNDNAHIEVKQCIFGNIIGGLRNTSAPATLHFYNDTNAHVGRYNFSEVDYVCNHTVYSFLPFLEETNETDCTLWNNTVETITVWKKDEDTRELNNYRFEINGLSHGNVTWMVNVFDDIVSNVGHMQLSYDNIEVFNNSLGTLYVTNDSMDYRIYMDYDGDGNIETEIWPDNITTSSTVRKGWNLITLPVNTNWTAETLGQNISACTVVCQFNSNSQSYVTHVVGIPYNDFSIVDGVGYFVYVSSDSVFTLRDAPISSVNVSIDENWNIVGWYHNYPTTAESLGQNISNTTVVCKFNAETQSYITHVVGIPYNNFTIKRDMGLFIYTTDSSIWHGEG